MSQDSQILMQILQLLTQGFSTQKTPDAYRGINRSAPNTVNLAIDQAYSQLTGSIGGPIGMLLSLGKNYILPKDFNRYGNLYNNFSGQLMPTTGGTYAGSFQNLVLRSRNTALKYNRLEYLDQLKRDFYGTYFDIVHKDPSKSDALNKKARDKFIKLTLDLMINIPKALNVLLDPADIQRTVKGIKLTLAGIMNWSARRNPLDINNYIRTKETSKLVTLMVRLAAGKDESKHNYGGFSGGGVASLAGILAQQLDLLGGASSLNDIKNKLQNLKKRIQGLSQALAPLRDIFGNDIPSMISRIQLISGMLVSTMTQSQVRSLATNITDMSRYSNVDIGQMAAMGHGMAKMVAQQGGSNWAQLGAQLSGVYAAGLLTPGNGAFGLMPAQFKANTLNMLASAQDSLGSQLMAMAYGLAKLSVPSMLKLDFDKRVSDRMKNGKSAIQAAKLVVALAQGNKQAALKINLYEGQSTLGNLLYRISGRGGKWASRLIWKDLLNYAIMGARQNGQFTYEEVNKALSFLKNLNAAQLTELGSNSLNFIRLNVDDLRTKRVLYSIVLRQGARFTQAASWNGEAKKIELYQQLQKNIKDVFKSSDSNPSNMYSRLVKTITSDWYSTPLSIRNTLRDEVRSATVALLGQSVLGLDKITDKQQGAKTTANVLKQLTKLTGSDAATGDLIQYAALGAGKDNLQFQKKLKLVTKLLSTVTLNTDKKKMLSIKLSYRLLNMLRYTGGNKSYEEIKKAKLTELNKKKLTEALLDFKNVVNNPKTSVGQRENAYKTFARTIQSISRINKLDQDTKLLLSREGKLKKKALKALFNKLTNGELLSEELFKKANTANSSLTYALYRDARNRYNDGYDMKADVFSKLGTVLSMLEQWLRKQVSK